MADPKDLSPAELIRVYAAIGVPVTFTPQMLRRWARVQAEHERMMALVAAEGAKNIVRVNQVLAEVKAAEKAAARSLAEAEFTFRLAGGLVVLGVVFNVWLAWWL